MNSILVLGLTCLLASLTSLETMSPILLVLLLLNAASAVQDICVDSLAIEILEPGELGAGNMIQASPDRKNIDNNVIIQVVAYKAGSVFAGAALLWVNEAGSWSLMWIVFGSLYFTCLGLIWGLGLGYGRDIKEKKQSEDESQRLSLQFLVDNWQKMISVPGTVWMVTFVMFYKLCERGEGTLPIYLVDKAIPVSSLAFWTGVVRSVASIGGSALSGFLLSSDSGSVRVKPSELMYKTACLRIVPISVQFVIILCWGREPVTDYGGLNTDTVLYYLSIFCHALANLCSGLMTMTACFTAMMSLSQSAPTSIQTSHYSLLSTMEVLGKLMFASVAGFLIDIAGLDMVFVLFVAFAIMTVPLLQKMPDFDKIKPFCDRN